MAVLRRMKAVGGEDSWRMKAVGGEDSWRIHRSLMITKDWQAGYKASWTGVLGAA